MRKVIAAFCLVLVSACPAHAQGSVHTPPPGSAERKAVLDAIRPNAQKQFGRDVVFVVKSMRVGPTHAFASVEPVRANGAKIRMQLVGGMGDAYAQAVLEKRAGRWTVLRYVAGASDVWWCEMQDEVPVAVLGTFC